jgi:hypothetical protein
MWKEMKATDSGDGGVPRELIPEEWSNRPVTHAGAKRRQPSGLGECVRRCGSC